MIKLINIDLQTGRRTSTFTDAEKEVTQSVILKREQIVQELAESQAMNGSTGQLNLGNFSIIPNHTNNPI